MKKIVKGGNYIIMSHIEKEELLNKMRLNTVIMHNHTNPHFADNGLFLTKVIELFDAAQPIVGKWEEIEYTSIENGTVKSIPSIRCTHCKKSDLRWYKEMKYCPNCGAEMG